MRSGRGARWMTRCLARGRTDGASGTQTTGQGGVPERIGTLRARCDIADAVHAPSVGPHEAAVAAARPARDAAAGARAGCSRRPGCSTCRAARGCGWWRSRRTPWCSTPPRCCSCCWPGLARPRLLAGYGAALVVRVPARPGAARLLGQRRRTSAAPAAEAAGRTHRLHVMTVEPAVRPGRRRPGGRGRDGRRRRRAGARGGHPAGAGRARGRRARPGVGAPRRRPAATGRPGRWCSRATRLSHVHRLPHPVRQLRHRRGATPAGGGCTCSRCTRGRPIGDVAGWRADQRRAPARGARGLGPSRR